MRISELARRAGVPVPTVKFYLRERLLPPGTPTARNQATYDDRHFRRLRLIRALTTVGGLEIGAVRDLLRVLDDPDVTLSSVYGEIERVRIPPAEPAGPDGIDVALADIGALAGQLGWQDAPTRAGRESLARVLTALRVLGCAADVEFFLPFARAAEAVVRAEISLVDGVPVDEAKGPAMVRGILFDVMMALMLRTVRQNVVAEHFPGPPAPA